MSDQLNVLAQRHPLRAVVDPIEMPAGKSVAEIVGALGLREGYGLPVVQLTLDGRCSEVSVSDWARVRPKVSTRVEVFYRVEGPVVGAVLAAVISSAAPAIVTAVTGLTAGLGFSLAVAAVTVVGSLVVNALIPPVAPDSAGGSVSDPGFSITGSSNQIRQYGVFPRVLGRRRVYPPMTAKGYTEVVDGDIYFRGRYAFGWGPIALEDLRIGDTPVTEFSDVELEFLNVDRDLTIANIPDLDPMVTAWREGDDALTLYPDDVSEENESVQLFFDQEVTRYTRSRSESVSIDITFPQGLGEVASADNIAHWEVSYNFQYKRVGDDEFTDAGDLVCVANQTSLIRFTKVIKFPEPGEYEVNVRRLSEDFSSVDILHEGYLTALRSFRAGGLPSHSGISEVAVRIRASEQLNGQLDNLNGIAQQLAPVWDGVEWSDPVPVRHPAWIYARELTGPQVRGRVSTDRIVSDALKAWADQEPHWTCDYVVESAMRVADVLDLVCATGRARRTYIDGKYSIIRDGASGPIRQLFTPRNSWGFKGNISFPREIHGFRVRAVSERLDWEQDEITVYADGYGPGSATEFETLEVPGVVVSSDEAEQGNAWRLGRYHLAVSQLRPEIYEFHADWEHIKVTRGDKIQLVHDVPKIGHGAARVKSATSIAGAVVEVQLDEVFELPSGFYRMTVRSRFGDITRFEVEYTDDARWVVAPGAVDSSLVDVGDLCSIEELTQEVMEALIVSIEPDADESALIKCVPAAPAVLSADTGEIPPYAPIITNATGVYGPPLAVVLQVVSGDAVAVADRSGALSARIGVDLLPRGYTREVKAILRWRVQGAARWTTGQTARVVDTLVTDALIDGTFYEVEVQAVDGDGLGRGFVSAGIHQARARDFDYIAPVGWVASAGVDRVTLAGERYPLPDFREFTIYGAASDSDALTLVRRVTDPWADYVGEFVRFRVAAVDNSGVESPLSEWFSAAPRGLTVEDLTDEIFDVIGSAAREAAEPIVEAEAVERDALLTRSMLDQETLALSGLEAELLGRTRVDQVNSHISVVARDVHNRMDRSDAATAQELLRLDAAAKDVSASIEVERTARVEADEAEASQRETLAAQVSDNQAALEQEAIARANADSAEASQRAALAARVGDAEAAIISEATARAEADSAEANQRAALAARVGDAEAAINSEATTRAEADSALALTLQQQQSSLNDLEDGQSATASALTGAVTRVTDLEEGQTALTQSVSDQASAVTDLEGNVSAQAQTLQQHTNQVSDLDGRVTAQSQSVSTVQTTVANNTASIDQIAESVNGISSEYVVRVNAGGQFVGFVLAADASDPNAPILDMTVVAGAFRIVGPDGAMTPFTVYTSSRVVDGITLPPGVYMENVYIGEGFLRDLSVSGVFKSANYVENAQGVAQAGFQLDAQAGSLKLAGSSMSRELLLAQGSFQGVGDLGDGHVFEAVNTGIQVSLSDLEDLTDASLAVTAAVDYSVYSPGNADVYNSWAWTRCFLGGPRLFGFGGGNPQPVHNYQKDPATLSSPYWSTGTDQRVTIEIMLRLSGLVTVQNPTINWKVVQIT